MSAPGDPIAEALALRAEGMTIRAIANRLGRSRSAVSSWITDPDGSKQRERRKRYQGICVDCGGPTTGCRGREKAPKLCRPCTDARRHAPCGTRTAYRRGCSCDACRKANTDYRRARRKNHAGPPPSHGVSGYRNYGCRCEVCTRAHSASCAYYAAIRKRRAEAA